MSVERAAASQPVEGSPQSQSEASFYRATLASFIVCLTIGIPLVNAQLAYWLSSSRVPDSSETGCGWVQSDSGQFDLEARSPEEARRRKEFWLNFYGPGMCGRQGLALRPGRASRVFEQLFPGFDATELGSEFRDAYFSRSFNIDSWYSIDAGSRTLRGALAHSWQGNAELFSRFGADIVFVGSSQTFRSIIPSLMGDIVKSAAGRKPRIVMLSAPGMQPGAVRFMAEKLATTGRRARVAVFGYSTLMAYSHVALGSRRWAEATWIVHDFRTSFELKDRFPAGDWKRVFPLTLEGLRSARQAQRASLPIVPAQIAADGAAIASIAGRFSPGPGSPFFSDFTGIGAEDCDPKRIARDLRITVAGLRTIADSVVVYLPPTLPFARKAYPACFEPAVKDAVNSVRADGVRVITDDWASYGLDWPDFLYPTSDERFRILDPIHTNFAGAQKVTRHLGGLLRAEALALR